MSSPTRTPILGSPSSIDPPPDTTDTDTDPETENDPPPGSLNDIFNNLDQCIHTLKQPWCCPVMFDCVEGQDSPIDLFSLTGPENRHVHDYIFDRIKYPPTLDSLKRLISDIQAAANLQGIRLVNGGRIGVLVCQRGRRFRDEKTKHFSKDFTTNSFLQDKIRAYSYNANRSNQRKTGQMAPRGTYTCLPVEPDTQCKVRLTITQSKAREGASGYLYIQGGFGCHIHTDHFKVAPEHVRITSPNLNQKTVVAIQQASRAFLGAGNTRSIALEAGDTFVSNSQMTLLRRQAVISAKQTGGTTAEDLMDYLKNNDDISFVALYHNSEVPSTSTYHSHPSGRPRNEGRRSLSEINTDLTMTVPGRLESISQPDQTPAILSEYLNTSPDVNQTVMMDKTAFEYIHHSRTSQGVSPTSQLLLSSAWGIRSQIRRFRRYPETLYIDTTFKTNNEQRPFLMICGKDANGEIYIFLRIYLCSETAWQFRWCFSYVLPLMVGIDHLSRVKMVITDGDVHEYSQVDAAIASAFTNARRGRCGYHLVELAVQNLPL